MNRSHFPLLKKVVYLDSAAGALKPKEVLDAMNEFYNEYPINTHSTDSRLGVIVYQKVLEARKLVGELVNAKAEEVIFTSGATDSLNKIALMIEKYINEGDEILLSSYNHSSNVIPWIEVAKRRNAKIVYSLNLVNDISPKTKVVAYAEINNTLNENYDAKEIFEKAKKVNAFVINDAAQAVVHSKVDLNFADAIVFSGNKLYGPTGIGALVVKQKLLDTLEPVTFGGGAVAAIKGIDWVKKDSYFKYEPGTLNTAGIIGFGAAVKYLNSLEGAAQYERELAIYAFDELSKLDGVKIYSNRGDSIILFNVEDFPAQDVVSYLGHKDIILRAGAHCAKAIKNILSIRLSLAHYNEKADIDKFIEALKNGGDFLDFI